MNWFTTLNNSYKPLGDYISQNINDPRFQTLTGIMQAHANTGKPVTPETIKQWGIDTGIDNLPNIMKDNSIAAINKTSELMGAFNAGRESVDTAKQALDAGKQALDGTKKTDWGGILSGAGDVMAGIGALGSVGLGIWQGIENQKNMREQLDLARENFNFQKGLANRNIANSARQINEQVAARAGLADAYGARNGSDADRYNKAHRVDGSPIG